LLSVSITTALHPRSAINSVPGLAVVVGELVAGLERFRLHRHHEDTLPRLRRKANGRLIERFGGLDVLLPSALSGVTLNPSEGLNRAPVARQARL